MIDSFITGFKTPIICHKMRGESAFVCAKYNEAEQSLWTNSFKVAALPKGMEKKARQGAIPRPLIPGKFQTCKGCKLDVNILNFS